MSENTDLSAAEAETTDIAIIGMQCRFPGADDVDAYWSLLTHKREGSRTLGNLDPEPDLVRNEAAVEGIDLFDAKFFGYTPAEAAMIDPQQRVFLECAYHVFEQAGHDPDRYPGLVGVYAGSGPSNYFITNVLPHLGISPCSAEALPAGFANTPSSLPSRVSYHLNLTGPSIALNTACSTSLVAVHLACQELLDYRCDLALAGGVTVNPQPGQGYKHVENGPLSPDGRCRTFDADAAGMFPGDGVGVVLLKRLSDAIADGDRVRAVIKGSAVNNDGNHKTGFTAPSVQGQSEVIVAAQAVAGVEASSIGMVEAHGTATPIGDPIEVSALTKAFRESTDRTGYCLIGSAKTNIGHTDAAAGVAGLIKAALSVEHGVIPANLHYNTPNPLLDLDTSPFRVAADTVPWPEAEGPRRAGVSAFGIGGTNAHVVLEQAPDPAEAEAPQDAPAESLLVVSAASAAALDQLAAQLGEHLHNHSDIPLADVANTLQLGRRELPYRRSLVCDSTAQAATALAAPAQATHSGDGSVPLVLLLPGGGAQYVGMGKGLYETEDVFRSSIDECAEILARTCGIDLLAHLYGDSGLDEERLDVLFASVVAVEYALGTQLAAWGLRPSAMLGHSLGEYAAACLSGVMDIGQALPLVAKRGELFARTEGATTSIVLAAAEVAQLISGRLVISGVTDASSCTVSGPTAEVEALEQELERRGTQFQRVRVSMAVHSPELDPVLGEFADVLAEVTLRAPQVPYLSNVTGTWVRPEEATDPAYWVRHSREPVQLAAGFDTLTSLPGAVLLEVGPGMALTRIAQQHEAPFAVFPTMRHRSDRRSDRRALLTAVGKAWEHGIGVDWAVLSANHRASRAELPNYPFERQRYWLTAPENAQPQTQARSGAAVPVWRSSAPTAPAAALPAGRWLVLVGDDASAQRFGAELADAGAGAVDLVGPGQAGSPADYEHIVFLADGPAAQLDRERHIELARAVEAAGSDVTVHIVVRNAFDVTGAEAIDVAQWLAVGAAQWLRRNAETRAVELVDMDRPDAGRLVAELSAPGGDRTLAYRNGRRWVLDSEPVEGSAPAWSSAGDALRAEPVAALDEGSSAEPSKDLDDLCAQYVCAYLNSAGVPLAPGAEFSQDELIAQLRVVPEYRKIIGTFLRILREDGIVSCENGRARVRDGATIPSAPDLGRWCAEHPELAAQAELLEQCVRGYDGVLRGEVVGNEVVTPGGDDSLYRAVTEQRIAHSDFAKYRELIGTTLARLARNTTPARPLRVLEIGAGRGYLTWPVLETLRGAPAGSVEYCFTDVGRSFVVAAQRQAEAAGLDFVQFATLDVVAEPATQNLPLGGFDIVLAFNVVHVAPDLPAAIGNTAAFTAPGGALFLLEAKGEARCDALIDPLLTGWLDFNDGLRTDSPLMAPQQWAALLEANGFTGPAVYDSGPAGDHALLIAERRAPVRVLDPEFDRAIAMAREIAACAPCDRRTLLTGPYDDSLEAALAAAYAQGTVTARHRAGCGDWTYVDASAYERSAAPADRLGEVLGIPAVAAVALSHPTAAGPRVSPERPPASAEPASAKSSFNQRPPLSTEYCAPRTELEERIAAIWQRFFGYDRIGVNDNFLELGGESLLAMQIAAEQRAELGIEVNMRQMVGSGTVANVAAFATEAEPEEFAHAAPPARRGRAARRTADGAILMEEARS
ncbi:Beta-ketoacyl synthase [Segniliparus rotundus DSM 44985]|uniref:Beta-ketoacyl synthase n=1 Tax=Segniliparus rotundus (strain ATCC BAA-972 / CDC 1076 / CIP 108378 / DSM 44985 / JCM 13578) TaxID=640132 RepID=D6ZBC5_SEGRD|nr:type I polyketide synthase [Segniliparus rotundus]ADG98877.1 Beta-ketoacyl synthase [Segniliparus rotundus DSM 44985]